MSMFDYTKMPGEIALALKRAERNGYLINATAYSTTEIFWRQCCVQRGQPYIAGYMKRLYAVIEVDLDPCYPREFTREGGHALGELMRQHSRGVKQWSASGGRYHWRCARIPREHIDTLAREIKQNLERWTMVPEMAESIW